MKLPPVQSEMMLFETGFGKMFGFHQETKKKNSLLSLPFSLLQPDIKGCLNDLISKPKVYKVKTIKLWYYYFRPSGSL